MASDFISFADNLLSILTIIGQFIIVLMLYILFFKKRKNFILDFFNKYGIVFAFIVAFIAMSGSLFYSEIAGYEPCKLCWFQRIFMYPQVILLGIALLKKDKNIGNYIIWLSVIGAFISLYHYLLQIGVAPSIACPAVGYSTNCAQLFIMKFGYITIPMMALTAFLMIIIFMLTQKLYNKLRHEYK